MINSIRHFFLYTTLLLAAVFFFSCKDRKKIGEPVVVEKPAEINQSATELLQGTLTGMLHGDSIKGSPAIRNLSILKEIYEAGDYLPLWTSEGNWTPKGDSLYTLISGCRYYGLFPSDYFKPLLDTLRGKLVTDTLNNKNKLDASLWAQTDLYLTAGFVQMIKDLKIGRLLQDSADLKKEAAMNSAFFLKQVSAFGTSGLDSFTYSFEPGHTGYKELKEAMKTFVETGDFRAYSYVNAKDSLNLMANVSKRLNEEDSIEVLGDDSISVATAIKEYQGLNKMKQDGRISAALLYKLNETDLSIFTKLAINLDRYKLLPATLPSQYIWVNIPGYYLFVKENDTIRLRSKVVVGKSGTRTPVLSSSITDMITYPQWTIPASIIKKDILPGLKSDPSYTLKKGYSLVDRDGLEVDPYTVAWAKYETEIPYKVVQGSGDDNALGVLKFNFSNRFSVYLHDTNQRYLFSKKERSLSHGCVRVQKWDSLALYILRNDSLNSNNATPVDSLNAWLLRKEKHVIPVRKRIPLYIRYFTSEAKDNKIVFYDDIYGDDRRLRERFFKNKN
ncbi:MAG TPA: L,D-transpeptidase family protein [Chitinophagaceae bacterium]|nr:L,D-transpeptidase family protein [Chitinophagaceae bacterium]